MKRSSEIHSRQAIVSEEGPVPVNNMGPVSTGSTDGPIAGDNSVRQGGTSGLHLFGKGDLHRRDINQQKTRHRSIMRFSRYTKEKQGSR